MPEPCLIVEQHLAGLAGVAAAPHVCVVHRPAGRRRPWQRATRGGLRPDAVLDALDAAPGALALARPAWADPAAAGLPALARLAGREVVLLPPDPGAAAWVCRLAAAWAGAGGRPGLTRRAQAAASLAAGRCRAGAVAPQVPALRPEALGRWCGLAWRSCTWCGRGGGVAGAPCGRCGRAAP